MLELLELIKQNSMIDMKKLTAYGGPGNKSKLEQIFQLIDSTSEKFQAVKVEMDKSDPNEVRKE